MRLSVLLPTYNNEQTLPRVLVALRAQVQHGDEVLVIDDGSHDQSLACAKAAAGAFGAQLRVLSLPHRGAAAARNAGIRAAASGVLLFLGADIVPSPTLLQRHRTVHARFPQETVGCLGHVTWDQGLPPTPFMVWLEQGTQNAYGALAGATWVDPQRYLYGANVSLKRSLAIRAGGYDAQRFSGYGWEDVEFGVRLAARKFRLFYEPTARALHVHPHTIQSFLVRHRAAGQSLVTLQALHPQTTAWSPSVSTARWRARRVLYPKPLRLLATACATFASRHWIVPRLYAVVVGWAFTNGVQEQCMQARKGVEDRFQRVSTPDRTRSDLFSSSGSQKVTGERVVHRVGFRHDPHAIHRFVHKD